MPGTGVTALFTSREELGGLVFGLVDLTGDIPFRAMAVSMQWVLPVGRGTKRLTGGCIFNPPVGFFVCPSYVADGGNISFTGLPGPLKPV